MSHALAARLLIARLKVNDAKVIETMSEASRWIAKTTEAVEELADVIYSMRVPVAHNEVEANQQDRIRTLIDLMEGLGLWEWPEEEALP